MHACRKPGVTILPSAMATALVTVKKKMEMCNRQRKVLLELASSLLTPYSFFRCAMLFFRVLGLHQDPLGSKS